jgi:hypothetical protein
MAIAPSMELSLLDIIFQTSGPLTEQPITKSGNNGSIYVIIRPFMISIWCSLSIRLRDLHSKTSLAAWYKCNIGRVAVHTSKVTQFV